MPSKVYPDITTVTIKLQSAEQVIRQQARDIRMLKYERSKGHNVTYKCLSDAYTRLSHSYNLLQEQYVMLQDNFHTLLGHGTIHKE